MRILAIVIIYKPDWILLKQNLQAFYRHVEEIILWNNTETVTNDAVAEKLKEFSHKIIYKGEGKNIGISQVLNYAWQYAKDNHFNTILTMDEDSIFDNFPLYKKHVQEKWNQELCLCGPLTKKSRRKGMRKIPHLITSGMLVPTKLVNVAGGYENDFFVDGIDVDFCINLRKKGYTSYCNYDCVLKQKYGEPNSKNILGITLHSPNYSASRLYGIFRNHIIILKKYNYPLDLLYHIIRLYFFGFIVKGVLFVDNHKKEKLNATWKGIRDGIKFKIKK
ncbi:MAG: glycosyl transferase family 2 [Prevotella sp.]|nr:glycosyl transferase family 2 [Prevotella sp.]